MVYVPVYPNNYVHYLSSAVWEVMGGLSWDILLSPDSAENTVSILEILTVASIRVDVKSTSLPVVPNCKRKTKMSLWPFFSEFIWITRRKTSVRISLNSVSCFGVPTFYRSMGSSLSCLFGLDDWLCDQSRFSLVFSNYSIREVINRLETWDMKFSSSVPPFRWGPRSSGALSFQHFLLLVGDGEKIFILTMKVLWHKWSETWVETSHLLWKIIHINISFWWLVSTKAFYFSSCLWKWTSRSQGLHSHTILKCFGHHG